MTIEVAPPRLRETIAEEVRALMARRRMSGVALAQIIGRNQAYVSRRLTGEVAFDVDDLERIAAALGVPVLHLLPAAARGGVGSLAYRLERRRGRSDSRAPAGRRLSESRRPNGSRPRLMRRPVHAEQSR